MDTQENWRSILSADFFQEPLQKYIGHGSFADVYQYTSTSKQSFAVKRFQFPNSLEDLGSPPAYVENVHLLSSLNHENIVKLWHVKRNETQIFLFLEFMEGKTLKIFINKQNERKAYMPEATAIAYTAQVLNALDYLHVRSIAHRDIKPENLLLTADYSKIKVADFNLCKQLASSGMSSVAKGTWNYMAPEVARCDKYSVKSDIWSLGATLVEMLSGVPPFSKYRSQAAVVKAINEIDMSKPKPDYDLSVRNDLTQASFDLLDDIFQPLSLRPSAAALLARECFSSINENAAANDTSHDLEYSLDYNNKSQVLIINNEKYATYPDRPGSQVDVNGLIIAFEVMRIKAIVEKNLTAAEIIEKIRIFLAKNDTEKSSSIIVVLLAHGKNKEILGVDEKPVSHKSILELLINSTHLGKPKLLLIQACRGDKYDTYFLPYQKENNSNANSPGFKTTKAPNTAKLTSANVRCDESEILHTFEADGPDNIRLSANDDDPEQTEDETASDNNSGKLHEDFSQLQCADTKSDIIVAYSTYSKYKAFRSSTNGSFFIQSFCDVVRKYWKSLHVLDILTETHSRTASAVLSATEGTFTQVPLLVASLRRQYYLSHPSERITKKLRVTSTADETPKLKPQPSTHGLQIPTPDELSHYKFSLNTTPVASDAEPAEGQKNSDKKQKLSFLKRKQPRALLIVAGGQYNTETLAYDTISDTWRKLAPMSNERYRTAATLWNGKMVVAGGHNSERQEQLNSVEQYDPETDSWTVLPNMLHSRRWLGLVCFQNSLFAIAGQNSSDCLDTVEQYNSDTKQWQLVAPLNTGRRGLFCAITSNGILAAGGFDGYNRLNSCEMFGGATQTWKYVASLVIARSCASPATLDDKVYIFGGWNGSNHLNSVEQYVADKWTLLRVRLSIARDNQAAATVNNRIYLCGGDCSLYRSDGTIVESFDASKMRISCVAALPKVLVGAAAVCVPVSKELYNKLFQSKNTNGAQSETYTNADL